MHITVLMLTYVGKFQELVWHACSLHIIAADYLAGKLNQE